jgi:hypothetical protein
MHPTLLDLANRTTPMAEKKKRWIQKGAEKHPGLFARKAARAGETTREYAEEKKDAGGTLGKEANFALNAMGAAKKARRARLYTHPRSSAS